jgi:hypothetical protein
MVTSRISPVDLPEAAKDTRRTFLSTARSGLYIVLVLIVALGTGGYSVRKTGIFSCSASGYGPDSYLGYCGATSYGDYDHGAIWFGLEPATVTAAANAQVLFLGNSRTVFGFSSKATDDWFSSLSKSYYLLGFSHFENYTFEGPLLRKLHPKAKVYIINIDSFFEQAETGPGRTVMLDESARSNYEQKRRWQFIHKAICTKLPSACGHNEAIFRSRPTGAWLVVGDRFKSEPVSYSEDVDQKKVASYSALGKVFLPTLSAADGCTILTTVPTVKTDLGTGKAVADALGLKFVAPKLDGLVTFDQVHLNPESAQRWSTAFFEQAGPQIQDCLNK